jgi:methyl-accepting chemotaxis protein
MKWFHNIKIDARLMAAFIGLGILTGVVGSVGIHIFKNSGIASTTIVIVVCVLLSVLFGAIISFGILKPILKIIEGSNKLSVGDINAEIKDYINDEFGILINLHSKFANYSKEPVAVSEEITDDDLNIEISDEPILNDEQPDMLSIAAEYIDRISKGDIPSKFTEEETNELSEIQINLNNCIDTMDKLFTETDNLLAETQSGNLGKRAKAKHFSGRWRDLVSGINNLIDVFVAPINITADYIDRISRGDIPPKITESYDGDFNEIKNSLNKCIDAVNALVSDANMLSESAVEGTLSTRADATKHQGDFKKIIDGFNNTLDAIVNPLKEAAAVLNEMSLGNLQVTVVGDYQGDHADIKNALNDTISILSTYIGEISEVLGKMVKGDLDIEITADYRGDFVSIKNSLNDIIDSFNQVMSDLNESSDQLAGGSRQVSDASSSLSQGAAEQASAIEQLSASIMEVASQTKQNAANATEANGLADTAKNYAALGTIQMKDMINSMEAINEASRKVSKVIKVIDDIAFQTNMLALNAAVEAARAGQHGKGFAVVAEEVRNLAARSATAVKETSEMIETSLKRAEEGTKIANETATALDKIVTGVDKAASLVAEIATASNLQATGIAQINKGIEQVSKVVQTNSATAEESAASSEELSGQAEALKQMVTEFKLKGDSNIVELNTNQFASNRTRSQAQAAASKAPRKISITTKDFGKY